MSLIVIMIYSFVLIRHHEKKYSAEKTINDLTTLSLWGLVLSLLAITARVVYTLFTAL